MTSPLFHYHVPASAPFAKALRPHFDQVDEYRKELMRLMNAWKLTGKSATIWGEGSNLRLSAMAGTPGWKHFKTTGTYGPDRSTAEGKVVILQLKHLHTLIPRDDKGRPADDRNLSAHHLGHEPFLFKRTDEGLAMIYAIIMSCDDHKKGVLIRCQAEVKKASKKWPKEAKEVTMTAVMKLAGHES